MASVVLLRGVNVGGARVFRPAELVKQLKALDVVNIGAAGTFVVRKPIAKTRLEAELRRRLAFETDIMICEGRDFAALAGENPFRGLPSGPEIVRFLSVSAKPLRPLPLPLSLPEEGDWLVRVVGSEGRFIFGAYRRQMKAIGLLGKLEKRWGVPLTTRSWNTVDQIVKVLDA